MKMSNAPTRPYRMVARAEAVEETRAAILEAAVAAFWDRPAEDVPLEDVASRAGVSSRTILRHFETKQGLFEAAVAHEAGRVEQQRAAAPTGDLPAAVAVLVAHYEEMGEPVLRLLAEEHRSPALAEVADGGRALHRAWCRRVFAPALDGLEGVARERRLAQLTAVCDVHTWRLLRHDAGLSRRQTELALVELLRPLTEARP